MDLDELRRNWDGYAQTDPLWAIIARHDKRGGRWEIGEFFATGRHEIKHELARIRGLAPKMGSRRALDFGCGVGRLSQALCESFEFVDAVDISASMLDLARKHNRFGENCTYHLNTRDDLTVFKDCSFDLIYTNMVLQHMKPEYAQRYIAEFMRLLSKGGVAVFQLPAKRVEPDVEPDLPDDLFQAEIWIDSKELDRTEDGKSHELRMRPGETRLLTIHVKNQSPHTWPDNAERHHRKIQLGDHWLDTEGAVFVEDDHRGPLDKALAPGETYEFEMGITGHYRPGEYYVAFDMMEDLSGWFSQRGCPALIIPVRIAGEAAVHAEERPEQEHAPRMEMHGVKKEKVLEIIKDAGVEVLAVDKDNAAGENWISYCYTVRRA